MDISMHKKPNLMFRQFKQNHQEGLLKKTLENLKIYKSTFFELLWVVSAIVCVCVCVCVCVFACVFFFQFMSEIIR